MSRSQQARPTKQERRDAARERARELREAQQRRERRNRWILISGIVAFVAIVAIAIVAIVNNGSNGASGDVADRPAGGTDDGAITVGSGGAGTVNEGAPEVDVYLDYACPHCAEFEATYGQQISDSVEAEDITLRVHTVAYMDDSGDGSGISSRGGRAAAAVADGAPEEFMEFNNQLFAEQAASQGEVSDEQIAQVAADVGVDEGVIDSFGPDTFNDWIVYTTSQARNDDIDGTPTVKVDGEEVSPQPGWLEEAVAG